MKYIFLVLLLNLVALFIGFIGFIVLLIAVGIEPSTRFRFINPMDPRNSINSINSMNTIPLRPFSLLHGLLKFSGDIPKVFRPIHSKRIGPCHLGTYFSGHLLSNL